MGQALMIWLKLDPLILQYDSDRIFMIWFESGLHLIQVELLWFALAGNPFAFGLG